MAARQLEDIGAIEEVDVGGYECVDVKRESVVLETAPRRHPTAGIRNRCPYGCGKLIALRTIDYHRTNGRFVRWLELKGGAHFRHKSGSKRRQRGKGIFMACNSRVSIEMCGDHYGHDIRMRLPPIIKSIIAQRQMEGESSADIIDYLRRRWEVEGIPTTCEIWEEELLDMVGIVREGVPRVRPLNEKTTEEIAVQQNWPRPIVFTAKVRMKNGEFVPHESILEAERESRVEQCQEDCACVTPEKAEEFDTYDGSYPPPKKPLLSDSLHQAEDSADEYVDVDGVVETGRLHPPSPSREVTVHARRNYVPRGTALSKEDVLQKLLLEIDSLKNQVLDSANSVSAFSLHYVLLRLKTLRPMIGHTSPSPDRAHTNGFRNELCQTEGESSTTGSMLPFEVLSDDEDIALSAGGAFEYNNYIWR
ncbi:hypothetical protein TELCIR_01698 [Teladorsagia circumcincta]|uniref:Uncharacterized protein n=1 Tax=Teladorsagia circumcincta TaxID=45464 RepID=A0A2G9V147_TELCI|nr:hypothetical protein TELCIR_01698 [Teladorsagia circumcincta]